MAGRDSWDEDRWDERGRERYESREPARQRDEARTYSGRGFGRAPSIGPTGINAPHSQAGDVGTSGRYYEDYQGRADYGGYGGGAPSYGVGAASREGEWRYGRPDPARRATYRDRDVVGDDEVTHGPYADYGRAYSGYGAGGGYTPDYREGLGREGLGRERRSWGERSADEIRRWFGDPGAERRRDWDAAAQGHHRGRGPKGYKRSDERIREDVSDRLTDDPVVDASNLEVSVTGGEVTLGGTVPSRTEKRRAEDCAESVSGVGHVQNNLRVSHIPQPGSIAAQTDPRIAAVSEGRDADAVARDLSEGRDRARPSN
jgi:osmotically-inducible protein OsmY